eukprot:15473312-Alexandrium_andersonii.AAC.1
MRHPAGTQQPVPCTPVRDPSADARGRSAHTSLPSPSTRMTWNAAHAPRKRTGNSWPPTAGGSTRPSWE